MKMILSFTLFFVMTVSIMAQTNLLSNPNADSGINSWRAFGDSKAEEGQDENPHFVLRNGSNLTQIIKLGNAAGRFVLLIGLGKVDQISKDRILTGLPSLGGYLFTTYLPGENKINTYMSAQRVSIARSDPSDQWVLMYGIFEVPADTIAAQVNLMQAERNGEPHDGASTRFDNLGFYLFDTKEDALAFAKKY